MFRFLHTSDWQMGMMAPGLGDAGEKVRAARIESLRNVLAAAENHQVQAILVAGDIFENNLVSNVIVESVVAILNDQTNIPIYLIPGNHDPFSRDSVYRRSAWSQLRQHIHVLTAAKPIALADGVTLFPCPLTQKHGFDDPTAWIPDRQDDSNIRISMAHGSMRIRPDIGDDDFPIGLNAAERAGLDYLALGHWHSKMSYPLDDDTARTYYSGTHESNGFSQRDSGNVLLVTIDGRGKPPRVETVRTGILDWLDREIDLGRQPLTEAARALRELPGAERTLVRVSVHGQPGPEYASELADMAAMLSARFLHHSIDDGDVTTPSFGMRFGGLLESPYLRRMADELEGIASGKGMGDTHPVVAHRALQILQEIAWSHRDR